MQNKADVKLSLQTNIRDAVRKTTGYYAINLDSLRRMSVEDLTNLWEGIRLMQDPSRAQKAA